MKLHYIIIALIFLTTTVTACDFINITADPQVNKLGNLGFTILYENTTDTDLNRPLKIFITTTDGIPIKEACRLETATDSYPYSIQDYVGVIYGKTNIPMEFQANTQYSLKALGCWNQTTETTFTVTKIAQADFLGDIMQWLIDNATLIVGILIVLFFLTFVARIFLR